MDKAKLAHWWLRAATGSGSYICSRSVCHHQVHELWTMKKWRLQSRTFRTATTDGDSATYQQLPPGCGFSRILTDDQRVLFHQANQLSSLSKSLAMQVGNVAVKEDSLLMDIARLQTLRQQRQRQQHPERNRQLINESTSSFTPQSLFTVVFAGEFNSGKSTLINALLGSELLETGVLPTTDALTVIMADGGEVESSGNEGTGEEISSSYDVDNANMPTHTHLHLLSAAKFPILSDLCLIDTPGTNAILSLQHTNLTLRILHDADLIIFVTSADRPFSESEQNLLRTSIKSYRKRVVLVINKMDVLERQKGEDHGETTKKRVVEYVVEHAGDLLGAQPVVIPLSARDALSMKLLYSSSHGNANDVVAGHDYQSSLWNRSNLGALEQFLLTTLTASSKVKTKLLNPIGVAEGILAECQQEIRRQQEELEVDVMTLRLLQNQTDAWERDLKAEIVDKCRLSIREVMEDRAKVVMRVVEQMSYFHQWKLGIGLGDGSFDQIWAKAKQHGHVTWVSKSSDGFAPKNTLEVELMSIARDYTAALISRAAKQGADSLDYLGKRPVILGASIDGRDRIRRMVGSVRSPSFRLLEGLESSVTDIIHKSVSEFPSDESMSAHVYTSLRRTAVLSQILVGTGVAIAAFSPMDIVVATSGASLCVIGGVILPLGNQSLTSTFKREWMMNAARLDCSLEKVFEDACHQVRSELSESVSPFSRYVESTGTWLKELSDKLDKAMSSAHSLRSMINKACQ